MAVRLSSAHRIQWLGANTHARLHMRRCIRHIIACLPPAQHLGARGRRAQSLSLTLCPSNSPISHRSDYLGARACSHGAKTTTTTTTSAPLLVVAVDTEASAAAARRHVHYSSAHARHANVRICLGAVASRRYMSACIFTDPC